MFIFDNLRKKIIQDTGSDEKKLAACLNCFSIRNIFLDKYRRLIQIELLPEEEKRELWTETKRLMPGKEKEEMIEGCKTLYVISNMI